jgi:hypothetical protein
MVFTVDVLFILAHASLMPFVVLRPPFTFPLSVHFSNITLEPAELTRRARVGNNYCQHLALMHFMCLTSHIVVLPEQNRDFSDRAFLLMPRLRIHFYFAHIVHLKIFIGDFSIHIGLICCSMFLKSFFPHDTLAIYC